MEAIEHRRQRGSSGQWKSHEAPLIKLEMPRGQIVVFQKTMEMAGFVEKEAVMFSFNKKEQCGYIYKEEPQDDSYYLRNGGRGYTRFTSKDLMIHMIEVFNLGDEKAAYFKVSEKANEKGAFKFVHYK